MFLGQPIIHYSILMCLHTLISMVGLQTSTRLPLIRKSLGKIDTYIAKEYLMLIYGCFFALFLGITLLLHFVLRPGCQSSFNVPNRSWWLANPVRERAAYLLAFNWVVVLQLLTQAFLFCTFLIVFEVAREQAKWGDTSVQFPTGWFIGLGLVPYLVAVAALVFRMHRTFLHPAI